MADEIFFMNLIIQFKNNQVKKFKHLDYKKLNILKFSYYIKIPSSFFKKKYFNSLKLSKLYEKKKKNQTRK